MTTQRTYTDGTESHRVSAVKTPATRKGDKFKVVIHIDDEPAFEMGGARAGRAQAVIVTCWRDQTPGGYGLRADLAKAEGEARGLKRTEMKTRSRYTRQTAIIPLNPARYAVAVPVTLDPSHDWDNPVTVKALS